MISEFKDIAIKIIQKEGEKIKIKNNEHHWAVGTISGGLIYM